MAISSSSSHGTRTSASPTGPNPAIVKLTNKLSPSEFADRYLPSDDPILDLTISKTHPASSYNITIKSSTELTKPEFNDCYDLVEATSSQDYKASSVQWRPRKKKQEMKDPEMRYLLLQSADSSDSTTTPPRSRIKTEHAQDAEPVLGFLSFMITFDDDWDLPVLYVYEIHLGESFRGKGVGGHMMRIAEVVARRIHLAKVMLTVFTSNKAARGFYEGLGYEKDACSPPDRELRGGIRKEADYIIMSLDLLDRPPSMMDWQSSAGLQQRDGWSPPR